MDEKDLEKYSDYWTEDYYVLVKSSDMGVNERPRYSIMDVERHMFSIIEDSSLADQIVQKMISKGAKTFNDIKDLPPKTIPQHWTPGREMFDFYEAIKPYHFSEKQVDKLARHFLGKNLGISKVRHKIELLISQAKI